MRQITIVRIETGPDSIFIVFPESSNFFPGKLAHKDDNFSIDFGHGWVATIKKEDEWATNTGTKISPGETSKSERT